MAVYRLPRGMPWVGDQPRCFMCKHELNVIDYFSIISYFIWRGTCRYCKGKYECNFSYFLTEFGITAGLMLAYMKFGFGDDFFLVTLLVVACVIAAVVDAEHKRIPSKILISTLLIGVIHRSFHDQIFYGAFYGGIIAGLAGLAMRQLYFTILGDKITGRDYQQWQHEDRFAGPGMDYVKLLAIAGVFLPFIPLGVYIVTIGSICLLWRFINQKSLRIGTIMASGLCLFIIYPEIARGILKIFTML